MARLAQLSQVRKRVLSGRVRDGKGRTAADATFTGEKPSAFLYFGVSMIALLKDLLDFAGVGSLPGIGTVVTLCFTFLIWILLALFDRSSRHTRKNMALVRGLIVIAFGLIEGIGFGLNFLPLETLMVIVLYQLARHAWKEEQIRAEGEQRLSAEQARAERREETRQARAEGERLQEEMASEQRMAAEQQSMDTRRRV